MCSGRCDNNDHIGRWQFGDEDGDGDDDDDDHDNDYVSYSWNDGNVSNVDNSKAITSNVTYSYLYRLITELDVHLKRIVQNTTADIYVIFIAKVTTLNASTLNKFRYRLCNSLWL
jgi:hypothetical protein